MGTASPRFCDGSRRPMATAIRFSVPLLPRQGAVTQASVLGRGCAEVEMPAPYHRFLHLYYSNFLSGPVHRISVRRVGDRNRSRSSSLEPTSESSNPNVRLLAKEGKCADGRRIRRSLFK